MRYMMIIKSDESTEAGQMPSEQELLEMGNYNTQLVNAGIMLAGEGLLASDLGARVNFSDGEASVVDGPFAEAKELVAGFWIIDVKSKDEAVEWARRVPAREGQIEIRKVAEAEDFGDAYTPEVREQEDQIRAAAEQASQNRE